MRMNSGFLPMGIRRTTGAGAVLFTDTTAVCWLAVSRYLPSGVMARPRGPLPPTSISLTGARRARSITVIPSGVLTYATFRGTAADAAGAGATSAREIVHSEMHTAFAFIESCAPIERGPNLSVAPPSYRLAPLSTIPLPGTRVPHRNPSLPPTSAAAPTPRHDRLIVALHWLVALSIVALLGIGWYMVGVPQRTPARGFYYNLHKSLGILAAALIVTLIARRLTHRSPLLPDSMPGWERKAARLGHLVLYLFMVLSVIAGYLTSSFSRFGPKFFGIPLPHWGWDDVSLREKFAAAHRVIALVFAVLIAVHVAAALKHLLVDRDGVFQRMLPGRSAAPPRRP